MKKTIALMMITGVLFSSCGNSTSEKAFEKRKLPLLYVICDFSSSLDTAAYRQIVGNVRTCFEKLSATYDIKVFGISESPFTQPVFEFRKERRMSTTPKDRENEEKRRKDSAEKLSEKLLEYAMANRTSNTCILQQIKRAGGDFRNYDSSGKTPVRLIVLSDMLEDCSSGSLTISIAGGRFSEELGKVPDSARILADGYSFQGLQNFKLGIIMSSARTKVNDDSLNGFWKEVFSRFGYRNWERLSNAMPNWIEE